MSPDVEQSLKDRTLFVATDRLVLLLLMGMEGKVGKEDSYLKKSFLKSLKPPHQ